MENFVLKLLTDTTKQVRKEIVKFIDECFEEQKNDSIWINPDKTKFSCDVSYVYEWWKNFRKTLLDKIQLEQCNCTECKIKRRKNGKT